MIARSSSQELGIPSILKQVSVETLSRAYPVLRGEVLGPRNALFKGSKLDALYAAIPVYFSDSFASCEVAGLGSVIFSWLVPISRSEAEFISNCGWKRFEERLSEEDPDLADVFREPMHLDK